MNTFAPQSDITGRVNMTQPDEVVGVICEIFQNNYPGFAVSYLQQAFRDIEDAFWGRYPGLLRCDTPYHDLRHSLSTALLMTRMIDGYQRSRGCDLPCLDADTATLAVLLALYHDIGFIRCENEANYNGATFTLGHEQRGVDFMRAYLAGGPLAGLAERASLIHATNFAKPLDELLRDLPPDMVVLCQMLGTADLVSQVAGRYYLERVQNFLYREFVISGMDRMTTSEGEEVVLYGSAEELLRKTPGFYEHVVRKRIDGFGAPYRCVATHFGGDDPYERGMQRNMNFLKELIARNGLSELGRKPVPLMPDGKT